MDDKDDNEDENDISKEREELDLEMAHRLLRQVGDQFCDLYRQEENALKEHMGEGIFHVSLH